ncbi:DNA methyltransferase [Candidatus Pseudothioglobus singularis]|nr:DNA methyltransferase [Candidatus Pseudothioglobus singularis]
MSRTSNEKVISDQGKHNLYIERYKEIILRLESKFLYTQKSEYQFLVNFSTNKNVPIHSWYNYKQGYSRELVHDILVNENPSKEFYVLDPFCGVGTTNLVANEMGYNSIGLDINPLAIFSSKVKNSNYSKNDIKNISLSIDKFNVSNKWKFVQIPQVVKTSFIDSDLNSLQIIKGYIDSMTDKKSSDFLHLAYLSIIEDVSIKIKDGNGLKFKKNNKQIQDIYEFFLNKCYLMLGDIKSKKSKFNSKHAFYDGSILVDSTFDQLKYEKVGISIFSPPYANCFDYCEVYKLELWLGGFVNTYDDFKKYRSIALRSHVNSKFDHTINHYLPDVDNIANLISSYNIWNPNIPDMVRGYFDDMYELLLRQSKILVQGGKCFIVVANSGYKGIIVPTDLLIADIAISLGYKVNNIYYARKIRASVQQNVELHKSYNNLMRESIIELELL